jgi:MoxR-like ATPase
VVLIDEIDKAEADLPNGLLEALGAGEFTPLGQNQPVKVAGEFPLVIITTNEERVLPNAFIRRCLVLHLKLPEDDKALRDYLVSRARVHFPRAAELEKSAELFQKSAELLIKDRRAAIDRRVSPLPGQAEYLDLIRAVLDLEPDSPAAQLKLLEDVAAFALRKHEEIRS